ITRGCRNPEDNLVITEDTYLCPGTFYLNDTGSNGTLIIGASDIFVIGNATEIILQGSVAGSKAINVTGYGDVLISNITIRGYETAVHATNASGLDLQNLTVYNATKWGVNLVGSYSIVLKNSTIELLNASATAINMSGDSLSVRGVTFNGTSSYSIYTRANNTYVQSSTFAANSSQPAVNLSNMSYPLTFVVSGNNFSNISAEAIYVHYAAESNTSIANNTISKPSFGRALYVGSGEIAHNNITNGYIEARHRANITGNRLSNGSIYEPGSGTYGFDRVADNEINCSPTAASPYNRGVHADALISAVIRNNTIRGCSEGIYAYGESGASTYGLVIEGNTVKNSTAGIKLSGDANTGNDVTANSIANTTYGLYIDIGPRQLNISHNVFQNNSWDVIFAAQGLDRAQLNNSGMNNTLSNGRLFEYYQNLANAALDASSNLGLVGCFNCSNVAIRDLVTGNNSHSIIFVGENLTITNVTGRRLWGGFVVHVSNNTYISNVSLDATQRLANYRGIVMRYGAAAGTFVNHTIYNTTLANFDDGIWSGSVSSSSNISLRIDSARIYNSSDGIELSADNSNATILGSYIENSTESSIYIGGPNTVVRNSTIKNNPAVSTSDGIRVVGNNVTISNVTAENVYYALYVDGDDARINSTIIRNATYYAIYGASSADRLVVNNSLLEMVASGVYDSGTNLTASNTAIANASSYSIYAYGAASPIGGNIVTNVTIYNASTAIYGANMTLANVSMSMANRSSSYAVYLAGVAHTFSDVNMSNFNGDFIRLVSGNLTASRLRVENGTSGNAAIYLAKSGANYLN
ncbi:MAG: right-handed parallel beta-helix repeat-containing protein, partial [Candidatus Aenigmatarchaeota archaeon]